MARSIDPLATVRPIRGPLRSRSRISNGGSGGNVVSGDGGTVITFESAEAWGGTGPGNGGAEGLSGGWGGLRNPPVRGGVAGAGEHVAGGVPLKNPPIFRTPPADNDPGPAAPYCRGR